MVFEQEGGAVGSKRNTDVSFVLYLSNSIYSFFDIWKSNLGNINLLFVLPILCFSNYFLDLSLNICMNP